MNKLKAYKMDGLGNDFVIFDNRSKPISLSREQIIKISDRTNVGCDQVIFINNDEKKNINLTFYNSDGNEISACGNGSRCVAYLLMKENKNKEILIKTKAGILKAKLEDNDLVTINMGEPNFDWEKIPLSKEMNNKNLEIEIIDNNGQKFKGGFSLSVGNPHVVFFVKDFNEFEIEKIGHNIENHNFFPQKTNVTFASVVNKNHIKIKVWERGAGLTKACGTAACATTVAACVLKLAERKIKIEFNEGLLNMEWNLDNNVYMTGEVSKIKLIELNI